MARPMAAKYAGCLSSGITPMGRPVRAAASRAMAMTSAKVRIGSAPSKAMLAGRSSGSRSRARRVLSSARVKSSVNQPVTETSSMVFGAAAVGEIGTVGHVSRAADLVLVAGDQIAVAGHDQIRLDEVGALFDGQFIGRAGVLGPLARGAAMGDDERFGEGDCDRAGPPASKRAAVRMKRIMPRG